MGQVSTLLLAVFENNLSDSLKKKMFCMTKLKKMNLQEQYEDSDFTENECLSHEVLFLRFTQE